MYQLLLGHMSKTFFRALGIASHILCCSVYYNVKKNMKDKIKRIVGLVRLKPFN